MFAIFSGKYLLRGLALLITLIPSSMSVFSFLNNISGWKGTMEHVIEPLLTMNNTHGNPLQTWRAIDSPLFANIVYGSITILEGLVFVIGFIAILKMLSARKLSAVCFCQGLKIAKVAAIYAFFVWGFFFYAIAGDWFLAWQNPDLNSLRIDAVNYGAMAIMSLISLHILEKEILGLDSGDIYQE